jgi:predicted dehydrogenase
MTGPRIALIGAGQMGSLHARVLAQSNACELVRIVEPRREVGQAIAETYGAQWQAEFDDLSDIDAVVVAAATPMHYEIAGQVIDRGLPVLVEKPLAATFEQSVDLVERSRKADAPLVCGLLERFNPAVRTAREIVRDVVQVNAIRHSPFVPRITTGVATDLLIHDVDLAIELIGSNPLAVKGSFGYFHQSSKDNNAEDCADATMTFDSGAVATISASRVSQRKVRQFSIMELDRLIEIDLLRRDITIYRHVAESVVASGAGYRQQTVIEILSLMHSEEPLAAQLNHFLALVANGSTADAQRERERILPAHRVVHEATVSAAASSNSGRKS